jgi:hypothetical protein
VPAEHRCRLPVALQWQVEESEKLSGRDCSGMSSEDAATTAGIPQAVGALRPHVTPGQLKIVTDLELLTDRVERARPPGTCHRLPNLPLPRYRLQRPVSRFVRRRQTSERSTVATRSGARSQIAPWGRSGAGSTERDPTRRIAASPSHGSESIRAYVGGQQKPGEICLIDQHTVNVRLSHELVQRQRRTSCRPGLATAEQENRCKASQQGRSISFHVGSRKTAVTNSPSEAFAPVQRQLAA